MNGKIVSLVVVLLMVVGSFGVVGTRVNVEDGLGAVSSVPLEGSWPELAEADVFSAGNKEDSCAEVTCYSLDEIECKYGETIRFQVHYTLDLSGGHLWDWAMCEATVDGETKYKEISDGYIDALFLFDVVCASREIEWEVSCKLTDSWGELTDSCSGSLDLVAIGYLKCEGHIYDFEARPGEPLDRSFLVRNWANWDSELDWEIYSYPDWGGFSFKPSSGEDIDDGRWTTVSVSLTAPELEPGENSRTFSGRIVVVNTDDSSDKDSVGVDITVRRSKDKGVANSDIEIESTNNELTNQVLKSKTSSFDQYPDLIVRPIVRIYRDPFFKFLRVMDIDILVKNTGDDVAVFPRNAEYVRTIYSNELNGVTFVTHWETYDEGLILGPNEEDIQPAFLDFIFRGVGGTITFIVDPNNIVNEGIEGEKNNEYIFKIRFFNQDVILYSPSSIPTNI